MTSPVSPLPAEDDFLLNFANLLLRRRRLIVGLAAAGAVIGLLMGLLSRHTYASRGTFLPQASSTSSLGGLALAASQLNLQLPTNNGGWVPGVYVELLQSRTLLEPVARDTIAVAEDGGHREAVADLLKVRGAGPAERLDRTILALRNNVVTSRELRPLGVVEVTVVTRWPSVSLAIAQQLIDGVNRFNVESRKSQARAEREFVEGRADLAEHALRDAEDQLLDFSQRNRIAGSAALTLARDRLQREVSQRQQLYTSLLQSREEARAREVRDTPVLTVLEAPRAAVIPEPRRSVLKAALGLLGGGLLGLVVAYLAHGLAWARSTSNVQTREFLRLLGEITPRFARRGGQ